MIAPHCNSSAARDLRRSASVCASVAGVMLLTGCAALTRPSPDGFPSLVAENVMRISIVVAFEDADFSAVAGRRFDVEVHGMAADELKSYLAHTARVLGREAGGVFDPDEPDVVAEVAVHVCGSDIDTSPPQLAWIAANAIYTGETLVDLCFRQYDGGVGPVQTLHGVASHTQTVVISFFKSHGRYYRRTYPGIARIIEPGESTPIDPSHFRSPRPASDRDLQEARSAD